MCACACVCVCVHRPIEPPKKPEAAPFFLPTVPTLARNPVFDTNATNTHTNDNNTDAAGHEEGAEEGPAGGSRILRSAAHAGDAGGAGGAGGLGGHVNAFLRLLRAGQDARDWTSFFGYIRELSPTALDREVRALQVGGAVTRASCASLCVCVCVCVCVCAFLTWLKPCGSGMCVRGLACFEKLRISRACLLCLVVDVCMRW